MSDNNEIMNKLKTITKQNIKSLTEQGVLYTDDKLQKNYIQNHSFENNAKAIPINIIYHSLYDQDNLCQTSNGKLNFQRYNLSVRNDYDIKFDKKTFDGNSAPKYFKMPINKCVNLFADNKSIKDEIDDLDSYPKVFEFQYNYQHPVPNPVLFGPKLLQNTDNYKIIFISPICLIIEQKSDSTGFTGIDCFYTSIRSKFDMELNDDLTIKKTLFNCYFGLNFTKSNWLQGKIKSSAFSQAEEGFTKKFLPAITKEINLTIKHYSKKPNVIKKITLRGKKTFNNGKSSILDDLIINDSYISDSEDEKRKRKQKENSDSNFNMQGSMKDLYSVFMIVMIILAIVFFAKLLGKEYVIIILLGIVVYNLFMINNKLDKLCKVKNL